MVSEKRKIGDLGEEVACKCLKKRGYKILQRNFWRRAKESPLLGEIDIIAKNKKTRTIHFIEVKTSENKGRTDILINDFLPERRVNWSKQKKLIKASRLWLIRNKIPSETPWQIDIMAVNLDFNSRKAQIKHFKNAIHY